MFALILKCHFYCNKRDVARFGEMSVREGGKWPRVRSRKHAQRGTYHRGGVYHTTISREKDGGAPGSKSQVDALGTMLAGGVYTVHMVCIQYVYCVCQVGALDEHQRGKGGDAKFAFSAPPSNSEKHVIGWSTDKTNWIFVILVVSRPRIRCQTAENLLCVKNCGGKYFTQKSRFFGDIQVWIRGGQKCSPRTLDDETREVK